MTDEEKQADEPLPDELGKPEATPPKSPRSTRSQGATSAQSWRSRKKFAELEM